MNSRQDEAALCATRIATSTALASASTDISAKAAHLGIVKAYGERLAELTARPIRNAAPLESADVADPPPGRTLP